MSLLQSVRCTLRMHHWGSPVGDDWGAHQVCSYCGHSRRIGVDRPPDAHDNLGLHT
jgi:hypothetical protein